MFANSKLLVLALFLRVNSVIAIHNGQLFCSHCHRHSVSSDCNNFRLCEKGERCFTTRYTYQGHELEYTGCMVDTDCNNGTLDHFIDQSSDLPAGSVIKSQICCDRDGCNGLKGTLNRIACMSCAQELKSASQCLHAKLCNYNEECLFHEFLDLISNEKRIQLSCAKQKICEILRQQPAFAALLGKRQSELTIRKYCCKENYCNMFEQNLGNVNKTTSTTFFPTLSSSTTTKSSSTYMSATPMSTSSSTHSSSTTIQLTFPPTKPTRESTTDNNSTVKPPMHVYTTPIKATKPTVGLTTLRHTNPTIYSPTIPMNITISTRLTTDSATSKMTGSTIKSTTNMPTTQMNSSAATKPVVDSTTLQHNKPTTNLTTHVHTTRVSSRAQTTMKNTYPTTPATTSTTPSGPRCLTKASASDNELAIVCPESAPYCLNNITNYVDGHKDVTKECATAKLCYWIPKGTENSVYCSLLKEKYTYFADFLCSFCCEGDKCNQQLIPPETTIYKPKVIPPRPVIPTPTIVSTQCYSCQNCGSNIGTSITCGGSTPYCMNEYGSDNWGKSSLSKRCASMQECSTKWYQQSRNNFICTMFEETSSYNMNFDCYFCCTSDLCNAHARPPLKTLFVSP